VVVMLWLVNADPHRLAAVCTIVTSSAAPLYASSKLILVVPALYASHPHASPSRMHHHPHHHHVCTIIRIAITYMHHHTHHHHVCTIITITYAPSYASPSRMHHHTLSGFKSIP
jgi:hypothetical protein